MTGLDTLPWSLEFPIRVYLSRPIVVRQMTGNLKGFGCRPVVTIHPC
jgi:hypothetical protein